ncbi:hypothetical protein EDD15DRAFT_828 [Pisolithus albus]|nr:hypothetical protein EDD15DRAFT_828 [Pisolithus albus]
MVARSPPARIQSAVVRSRSRRTETSILMVFTSWGPGCQSQASSVVGPARKWMKKNGESEEMPRKRRGGNTPQPWTLSLPSRIACLGADLLRPRRPPRLRGTSIFRNFGTESLRLALRVCTVTFSWTDFVKLVPEADAQPDTREVYPAALALLELHTKGWDSSVRSAGCIPESTGVEAIVSTSCFSSSNVETSSVWCHVSANRYPFLESTVNEVVCRKVAVTNLEAVFVEGSVQSRLSASYTS